MVGVDQRWFDCDHDPEGLTYQSARLILTFHRHPTWQPCLPQLAALAFLSAEASDYE